MDELPGRAVVIGAGYIALEFAGILHGMGVDTHVMYRADSPLRGYTPTRSLNSSHKAHFVGVMWVKVPSLVAEGSGLFPYMQPGSQSSTFEPCTCILGH